MVIFTYKYNKRFFFLLSWKNMTTPSTLLLNLNWLIDWSQWRSNWLIDSSQLDQIAKHIKKIPQPNLFSKNPQMDNKETFGGMFQSLKAIALHIFLSSAWTSSTTSSASLFGLIYLVVIITKMSRPLWHFDMLSSTAKLERTGKGHEFVWRFTFT